MIHANICDCYDCRNGLTPKSNKAPALPKRNKDKPRKIRKIKPYSNKSIFTEQERKEYGEMRRFFNQI